MRTPTPLLALSSLLIAPTLLAQNVSVEKYTLPNGLTVILHEDHSLPVATINTWFRVGAMNEPPGRSGFAHLFEHLMFMGTARVPGNQFDVLMETGGGANNASTDLHRTNYFSWGPSSLLPTLLWLDADRLEDLGMTMTKEKLDLQRDVVRNELRQSVENAPYGRGGDMVYQLLFPPEHPYHNGVIGTHRDLEAATVDNVKDFFATFYVPSNASLVVAGDFNPAQIKAVIAEQFGTLPRGGELKRPAFKTSTPGKVVRATTLDKVELPKISYNYVSPAAFADGDAHMQLAAAVLADGKTSRLYKRLVYTDKLATSVSASQQGYWGTGIFNIDVLATPGADLDKIEKAFDEELAKFVEDGPTSEELDAKKASIELAALASLQSVQTKADKLNEYEFYWGEPNSFKRDLDRFRNAAKRDVRDWAKKVLLPGERVIVRILPEKPTHNPSARDQRPAPAAPSPFVMPKSTAFKLSNGMEVVLWERHDLPLIGFHVAVKPPVPLSEVPRAGLAALTAQMLEEGAGDRDALTFERDVQALGATFLSGADHEDATVGMTVLARNFDKGLALFADALERPRFDQKEWDRVKRLHLDELAQGDQEPGVVAARVASRLLYVDGNTYSRPVEGLTSTVTPLTVQQAREHYNRFYTPHNCRLFIAGDITPDKAKSALESKIGNWKPSTPPGDGIVTFELQKSDGLRVAIVDRPGAVQTTVKFSAAGFRFSDSKRPMLRLLNTILGGSFTSRLNQNLREKNGYTYGARSNFAMELSSGSFTAGAAIRADATGAALKEFFAEFKRIRGGDITSAEAAKARETVRNDTIRAMSSLGGLVRSFSQYIQAGLPADAFAMDLNSFEKANDTDLNSLANPALQLDNAVLVLVGDKKLILDQIKDLNLPAPVEYDAQGERLTK